MLDPNEVKERLIRERAEHNRRVTKHYNLKPEETPGRLIYYREWAPRLNYRKGRMVSTFALTNLIKQHDPGYGSVYMFDEVTAKEIIKSGESKGFNKMAVIANTLVFDLDGGQESLDKAEVILKSHGYGYQVFSSGGKGFHIYVPHELIQSNHLPYSHQKVVEKLGIECDLSLYQHGRLLSLPGRVHPKTGRRKELLYNVGGTPINIPIVERPVVQFKLGLIDTGDTLSMALRRLSDLTVEEPKIGNRHTTLWSVAQNLADAGITYHTALDLILGVTKEWKNPKPQSEIEGLLMKVFRQ